MQLIITDAGFMRPRTVQLSLGRMLIISLGASFVLMITAAGLYHLVFLKGAREGWPVVGAFLRFVVKDEFEQRDRYLRENLNVMAKRLGEMQAKLAQLDSLGERVSGLAGLNVSEFKAKAGQGGLLVGSKDLTMEELQRALAETDGLTSKRTEWFTVLESNLFEQKIHDLMIPTATPVLHSAIGSSFGWRIDPFTGTSALHTGLDFMAETGEPILAAAGGVVATQEVHPAYGNMVEVDHGNGVITRYAHASAVYVRKGDLIKRGQRIADVGSTGRSTGAHLHFEVLVQGIPQDPQKFLNAGGQNALAQAKFGRTESQALARRPPPLRTPRRFENRSVWGG